MPKKLGLILILTLTLTGCAGAGDSNGPLPETSETSAIDVTSQAEDLLLEIDDFPFEPARQSSSNLDDFNLYFAETLADNNGCAESLSLHEQVSKFNLLVSRESGFDQEFAFFGQWVFEVDSSYEASQLVDSFAADYFNQQCADTLQLGYYEQISATDFLPVGFKGHAWVAVGIAGDPGLSLTRSISNNGRFIMFVASMTTIDNESGFTTNVSGESAGIAAQAFSDLKLPD